MPPPGVNMDLIRQAMARRAQGGAAPMTSQVTQPTAVTPGGGPNNMGGQQPQMPSAEPRSMAPAAPAGGAQSPGNAALKAAGQANSPQFDDPTRVLGKALIGHLLKVL